VSREFVYVVTVKPSALSWWRNGLFRDVAAGVGKSEMIGFSDRAFVLYALDKPIYVGVFNSVVSSTAYGVPTIKEPVYDKGKGSWELRIYPASGDPRAKDLRNSPIIEKALKQSGIVLQGL
jgi:hypothetical protein